MSLHAVLVLIASFLGKNILFFDTKHRFYLRKRFYQHLASKTYFHQNKPSRELNICERVENCEQKGQPQC